MAAVELTESALEDLERLIRTHSLPGNTRDRVKRSLAPLEQFPLMGAELSGRWSGLRFVLGPWRWMILVYVVFDDDRVVVVTVQDSRSSSAATSVR